MTRPFLFEYTKQNRFAHQGCFLYKKNKMSIIKTHLEDSAVKFNCETMGKSPQWEQQYINKIPTSVILLTRKSFMEIYLLFKIKYITNIFHDEAISL